MLSPFLALVLPPLLLVPAMGLLSIIESDSPLEAEIRRKAFHVSIGLASLTFPMFLTRPWMVLVALSLAVAWMTVVRQVPTVRRHFGAVLHGADRASHGELYFAASIAALLLASNGESVLYIIPILILTVADAVAAIVGRAFPKLPLSGLATGKTTSGSVAFFVAALLVTWPTLFGLTDLSLFVSFAVAMSIASATCVAEAISSQGFDNLAIPTVALFILKLLVVGA
jgi:phytol kinase